MVFFCFVFFRCFGLGGLALGLCDSGGWVVFLACGIVFRLLVCSCFFFLIVVFLGWLVGLLVFFLVGVVWRGGCCVVWVFVRVLVSCCVLWCEWCGFLFFGGVWCLLCVCAVVGGGLLCWVGGCFFVCWCMFGVFVCVGWLRFTWLELGGLFVWLHWGYLGCLFGFGFLVFGLFVCIGLVCFVLVLVVGFRWVVLFGVVVWLLVALWLGFFVFLVVWWCVGGVGYVVALGVVFGCLWFWFWVCFVLWGS